MMTRRSLLRAALGAAASAVIAACTRSSQTTGRPTVTPASTGSAAPSPTSTAMPSCIVRPALTEGPYFVDEKLNRSSISESRSGVPLHLRFNVSDVNGSSCTALQGAQVDVWHCDAEGVYSDVSQQNTVGEKFCRGYQNTDANGGATFATIFPGWYPGRAVHIHFKIRAGNREFTSQLFFDDATIAAVMARSPYNGTPDTSNSSDNIYGQSGGKLTVPVTAQGSGYAGTFDIGLELS